MKTLSAFLFCVAIGFGQNPPQNVIFSGIDPSGKVCTVGYSPNITYTVPSPPIDFVCGNGSPGVVGTYVPKGTGSITTVAGAVNGPASGVTIAGGANGVVCSSASGASTAACPVTGTGSVVQATSPTLVTPNLGIPSAISLINGTGLSLTTGVTGQLPNTNLAHPSFTINSTLINLGDTTTITAVPSGVTPSLPVLASTSGGAIAAATTTGTGSTVALANGPTFVGPALGTPVSGNASNLVALPLATGVTGILQAANAPGLTGDVTSTAGSLATTVGKINGGAVPASAAPYTNASNQVVSGAAVNLAAFTGSTQDVRITNAVADARMATGGTIDGTLESGAQSWSSCPTWGTQAIHWISGPGTITPPLRGCSIPSNVTWEPKKGSMIQPAVILTTIGTSTGSNATTITLASVAGIQVGDLILIKDTSATGYHTIGPIASITGNVVGVQPGSSTVNIPNAVTNTPVIVYSPFTIAGAIKSAFGQQVFGSSPIYFEHLAITTPGILDVGLFGVDTSGGTDTTVTLQNAYNTAYPAHTLGMHGLMKVSTVHLYYGNVTLNGDVDGQTLNIPSLQTQVTGTTGDDTFVFDNGGSALGTVGPGGGFGDATISHMAIEGGLNAIRQPYFTNNLFQTNKIHIDNTTLNGFNCGILIETAIAQSLVENSALGGNTGGYCLTNNGQLTNYMDANIFRNLNFGGGSSASAQYGIYVNSYRVSGGNEFDNMKFNLGIGAISAISWNGATGVTTFKDISSELVGSSSVVATPGTTAGTAATSIVVTSASGFSASQFITIQAGGTGGKDVHMCIASGYTSGTTFPLDNTSCTAPIGYTLSANIPLQVTNTEVTNATATLFYAGFSTGSGLAPSTINFSDSNLVSSGGQLYSLDLTNCYNCTATRILRGRPIYDPNGWSPSNAAQNMRVGFGPTNSFGPLQYTNNTSPPLYRLVTPDTSSTSNQPTSYPTNPGMGELHPCVGTGTNNQSSPFGTISWYTTGNGYRQIFGINCDNGVVTIGAAPQFGNSNLVIGNPTGVTMGTAPASSIDAITLANGTCAATNANFASLCAVGGDLHVNHNVVSPATISANVLSAPFLQTTDTTTAGMVDTSQSTTAYPPGYNMSATACVMWAASGGYITAKGTRLCESAANTLTLSGSTAADGLGKFTAASFTSTQTAPTAAITGTGCSAGAVVAGNAGGVWAGTVAAGGTGAACTLTLTFPAAAHGWACSVLQDRTTPITGQQANATTTTAVFSAVAMTSADVLQFNGCSPY